MTNAPANQREIVEIEQQIIVLTDRWTASAGEVFVDLVFNIANALVIGKPSMGAAATNGGGERLWQLPGTGLTYIFGNALYLWPEGHFAEGLGIQPDIWVNGDALTAALALLRSAGLGES